MSSREQLGRHPKRDDPRTLHLCNFRTAARPPIPPACRWDRAIRTWGTAGNDRYGNCVIATAAHMRLVWRANDSGITTPISDAAIIELSRSMHALNGYNILDRLKYWRNEGMWGDKLDIFASVHPTNQDDIREAIAYFGSADIGLNLPTAWEDAELWDIGQGRHFEPGTWGGHSVNIVGFDANRLYLVTWGRIQAMTWEALPVYCDEAYACIGPDWTKTNNRTPYGYDLDALHAALATITRPPTNCETL